MRGFPIQAQAKRYIGALATELRIRPTGVYRCTPQDFSIAISALMDAGATIIGGCCGTTPDHIAAVHAMMESRAQGAGA